MTLVTLVLSRFLQFLRISIEAPRRNGGGTGGASARTQQQLAARDAEVAALKQRERSATISQDPTTRARTRSRQEKGAVRAGGPWCFLADAHDGNSWLV